MAGHGHCQVVCSSGAQLRQSLTNHSCTSEEGGTMIIPCEFPPFAGKGQEAQRGKAICPGLQKYKDEGSGSEPGIPVPGCALN